jgi:hypothetical protein
VARPAPLSCASARATHRSTGLTRIDAGESIVVVVVVVVASGYVDNATLNADSEGVATLFQFLASATCWLLFTLLIGGSALSSLLCSYASPPPAPSP